MEPADTAFFETSPDTTCTPKRAIYHNIQPTGKQAQRIIYWEHVRENSTFFLKAKKKKISQATPIISDTWNLLVDKTRFSPKFK